MMLNLLKYENTDEMMKDIVPKVIRRPKPMEDIEPMSEAAALQFLRKTMSKNKVMKSLIGQGYYECITPATILRNVLENPQWYTPYTPYQAELAQGRLEALLNYQTMITEMTKMHIANASMLDEATAAGECLGTLHAYQGQQARKKYFIASHCFPFSVGMVKTRGTGLNLEVIVGDIKQAPLDDPQLAAIIVQTPDTNGVIHDFADLFKEAHAKGVFCCCGTDLLSAALMKPPGEMGADIVFGSSQRFGIPLGYGGPFAGFFACTQELLRQMPGRLVGVSIDATNQRALRLALCAREQHIKRHRATSNICTAQALLANMSSFFAVFHGPEGIKEIANNVHLNAKALARGFETAGSKISNHEFFDTLQVELAGMTAADYAAKCEMRHINVLPRGGNVVLVSVDEATTDEHLKALLEVAGMHGVDVPQLRSDAQKVTAIKDGLKRQSEFLTQPVFNNYHSETEFMRYVYRLCSKDYGLQTGMIPLGSCTMKLNPAAAMLPLSWPDVQGIHPCAPVEQAQGYQAMFAEVQKRLIDATGLAACSLQPNSGAQGEYAGLRVIRAYHESKSQQHRNICLIPISAHGTNPASCIMAGWEMVPVQCNKVGRIDFPDFEAKCNKFSDRLAAIMITYPSTYGVFDPDVVDICALAHKHGAQVYVDGANLNALLGVSGPGFIGGDVCHINMHKTFSIPHGGGGPGVGPICVAEHLAPFLPNTMIGPAVGGKHAFGQIAQAPYGSASIYCISYLAMLMLGSEGLAQCAKHAVLNANYLMYKLEPHYKILYRGESGRCAHEFIIDLRPHKKSAGIEAEDVAKRLMDYGFHAPTLSFPVAGTLMVEPTESEPLSELNRFIEAMVGIRSEIREIEEGRQPKKNNVLTNAPHPMQVVCAETWDRPYSRELAAFPTKFQKEHKFWPSIGRVNNTYGDRNVCCTL